MVAHLLRPETMRNKRRRRRDRAGDGGARLASTSMLMFLGLAFIGAAGFGFVSADLPTDYADKSHEQLTDTAGPEGPRPRNLPVPTAPTQESSRGSSSRVFICLPLSVTDGDTMRCGSERVRLIGIDAPEMPGHCRTGRTCTPGDPFASKAALNALTAGKTVTCERAGNDRYGRTLASCSNGTDNISCAMVAQGAAVVRYDGYPCS